VTREQIEACKARAEAATSPWHLTQDGNGSPWIYVDPDDPIISCDLWDDAVFIAAARTDVPALCDLALRLLDAQERVLKLANEWDYEADRIETGGGDSPDMVADYRSNAAAIRRAVKGDGK